MGLTTYRRIALTASCLLAVAHVGCGSGDDSVTDPGPRGAFSVVTISSGDEIDSSYEIEVNDIVAAIIGPSDSVEFVERAVDTYSVALADVAGNCTVGGDNPRPVQVIADSSTATTFEITCIATAGVLQVVTSTSGPNPDSGYTLALDGSDVGTVGANDTVRTADLVTGEHTVRLGGIALNCRLVGDPQRTVAVPSESYVETTYEVLCTDQVGEVTIVTSTSGSILDPDGYEVEIEFGGSIPIGTDETKSVGSVAAGVTRVTLVESSVADFCSVVGENPRSVSVPAGGSVETLFTVACGTH